MSTCDPIYLGVCVVESHEGGVDDVTIGVCGPPLPLSDWLCVYLVMHFLLAPAPQHHLQQETHLNHFL